MIPHALTTTGPTTISQALLRQHAMLQEKHRELDAAYDASRARLIRLADHGASVEPGPFKLVIQEYASRTITAGKLLPLIGQKQVEILKDSVEPTVGQRVIVTGPLGALGPKSGQQGQGLIVP